MSGCDLACQTKIILNGGNLRGVMKANATAMEKFKDAEFARLDGKKAIEILNRMEDDAVELQKLIKEAANYTGPTGKMLE